jgi:metallophosphoesterase (TIGR03767 family)
LAVQPTGTTLEATIVVAAGIGYRTLRWGPGWPTMVRTELAAPRAQREDRRRGLAAVAHLTDIHIVDAQSPGRVEFLDFLGDPFTAAARPHELLTTHVASSMVRRINEVGVGPITGRPFDAAVSTGDNIDNQQWNELGWFLGVLDGTGVDPNSGAAEGYEGIQDDVVVDPTYWHPEPGVVDDFKTVRGFPDYPGLLEAALVPFATPAIAMPWYSTYGNHDGLIQGNLPTSDAVDQLLLESRKILALQPGQSTGDFLGDMFTSPATVLAELQGGLYPQRTVAADSTRISVKTPEWVQAHLDSPAAPGPKGHGYTEEHLDLPALYYSFDLTPAVLGISLDTGGYNSGSIGEGQFAWLEHTLQSAHARWFDTDGTEVRGGTTDRLVIVFSHFNPRSMNQPMTDPAHPDERRVLGDEIVALFHRYPNMVVWVNGHHHVNEVTPMPDPSGRSGGFWDINTASHVDYPEHARLIEVVDNADGTLSIFSTMIEHAAGPTTNADDTSVRGLASISRELAANDPQTDLALRLGQAEDLNVELALTAPFDLSTLDTTPTTSTTTTPTTATDQVNSPAVVPAFTG